MELAIVRSDPMEHGAPLLAVQLFEDENPLPPSIQELDRAVGGQLGDALERGDFKGSEGQTLLAYPRDSSLRAERVLFVGVGKRSAVDAEKLRRASATAVKQSARLEVPHLAIVLPPDPASERLTLKDVGRAVAEGATLGAYLFDEFKTKKDPDKDPVRVRKVEILDPSGAEEVEAGVRLGGALARGENLARTLGNLPGNVVTPSYLAIQAEQIADRFGMKATILGPDELRAESMGALLAVAQGTDQEPRLIVLEHHKGASDEKPLVLVGKGVTFDSGGISIKPGQGMEDMKFDMSGGAAVLGAMHAIGELDLPVNVIGIVPSTENLPSSRAMKPGDILRSHLGTTIEVVNTDAEGRLILADALSYARRFDPAAILDAATLTGACVIALGAHASAILGNDEELIEEVRSAGATVGQRVWQLPMFDEYREQIKSDYADIKNTGGRPAGTITAAWFLREFVGDVPWAHLDVAGTAYSDGKLSYQSKGSTGVPTRLLVQWVLARAG